MYFLHNEQLALELREGVDEYTKAKYLIFTLSFYYVLFELLLNRSGLPRLFDPFSGMAGLLIVIVGTYCSFKANREGDNKNFVERFVCLSWPITIKSLLIAIALVALPIMLLSRNDYIENLYYLSFIFSMLFMLSFFYLMMQSIKIASAKPRRKTAKKK
jgi:hypothetical protein